MNDIRLDCRLGRLLRRTAGVIATVADLDMAIDSIRVGGIQNPAPARGKRRRIAAWPVRGTIRRGDHQKEWQESV
jgi:hypothetical protein